MHDLCFFLTDLAASLALAAAASCRARASGAHFSGAAALGCVCGLAAPLLRDGLLGYAAATLLRGGYLGAAAAGAILGCMLARRRAAWRCFFWMDALGLSLAAGLGAVKGALLGLGAPGAVVLGVAAGLAGGFVRDAALGDIARLVEEDMYAAAAALGAMLGLALLWYAQLAAWICALAGASLALALRRLRAAPEV